MTLTWADIDARWPDAGVLWDRDVAPTLDWDVKFEEGRHGTRFDDVTLWAVDADQRCGPLWIKQLPSPNDRGRRPECHCRVWDGNSWITHLDWAWREYERDVAKLAANRVDPDRVWRGEALERMGASRNGRRRASRRAVPPTARATAMGGARSAGP